MSAPIAIGYALCGHCRVRRWPRRRLLVRVGWLKCRLCKWDVTPDEPCATGHQQHEYSMKGPDGLRRCWYCCRLSPRSRTELAQRTQPAGAGG